jgi:hypothetical protein
MREAPLKTTGTRLSVVLILAHGMCAFAAPAPPQADVWLVKDGKAQGHLFLPSMAGRPMLLAAEELRTYVRKMTGAELPLAYRDPDPRHRKGVGIQLRVRDRSEWEGRESAQAFTIEETLKPSATVPLTGITIAGNTEMAVLYGVYEYLGELGVRWFSPGEIGENVPVLDRIAIHSRKTSHSPGFLTRGMDFSNTARTHFDASDPVRHRDVTHHDYDLWLLRNRLMFQRTVHSGHWFDFNNVRQASGHAIHSAAIPGVDFAKEPERFAMVSSLDGRKERKAAGAQICFTNEKNIQQAIESAVAFFQKQDDSRGERNSDLDELQDCFPMGLSDSTGICECEACAKVAGSGPSSKDRLVWSFYNKVARGLNARMPGKCIGLYAPYFELTRPPEGLRLEPNIVAVGCRTIASSREPGDLPSYPFTRNHLENVDATAAGGADTRRVYDYSTWLGSPQISSILDSAAAYRARGVKHYHVEVMNRHEQLWPFLWALAQYAWSSDREPRVLLADYCGTYYGAAGAVVLDLIGKMDANAANIPRIVYGGLPDTQVIMSGELIADGRLRLKTALAGVEGRERIRLEAFRDTFEMFARTAEVYRQYEEALNTRTPEAIADVGRQYAEFAAFWNSSTLPATCSPRTLATVQRIGEMAIATNVVPKGREALNDRTTWLQELFAPGPVPASIPDLVALPEVWRFKVDVDDKGLREGWNLADTDDRQGWQAISTWNAFEPQGYPDVGGRFWYRVKFKVPAFPAGKRIFLRIGSLDDAGDIYINGQLAHSREMRTPDDWKESFAFEVTPLIRQGGNNVVAIRGYDAFGAGGLWRPCALYTD